MAKKKSNSPATEDELSSLHAQLANTLVEAMAPEPVFDREGEVVGRKYNSAVLNVVRQFLKDNNIQAAVPTVELQSLVDALPDFENDPTIVNLASFR